MPSRLQSFLLAFLWEAVLCLARDFKAEGKANVQLAVQSTVFNLPTNERLFRNTLALALPLSSNAVAPPQAAHASPVLSPRFRAWQPPDLLCEALKHTLETSLLSTVSP